MTELQEVLLNNFDVFTKCGYSKPVMRVSMCDKIDIIQAVGLQEVILDSLAELTQFQDGLNSLDVLHMIRTHKDLLRSF